MDFLLKKILSNLDGCFEFGLDDFKSKVSLTRLNRKDVKAILVSLKRSGTISLRGNKVIILRKKRV